MQRYRPFQVQERQGQVQRQTITPVPVQPVKPVWNEKLEEETPELQSVPKVHTTEWQPDKQVFKIVFVVYEGKQERE